MCVARNNIALSQIAILKLFLTDKLYITQMDFNLGKEKVTTEEI